MAEEQEQGPWTKYQQQEEQGPWTKYQDQDQGLSPEVQAKIAKMQAGLATQTQYPTNLERGGRPGTLVEPGSFTPKSQAPDPRTGGLNPFTSQVMQDQAANVLKGIPTAVTGIPQTAKSAYQILKDIVAGKGSSALEGAKQMGYSMIQPAVPVAKSLIGQAPPPESPEWSQAAQGAGGLFGQYLLGKAGDIAAPKVSDALRDMAQKQYLQALAPTTAEMKQRAMRVIPEMISRGVTGSLESLRDKADAMTDAVGQQRQAAVAAASQTQTNVRPVIDSINQSLRDNRIVIDDPQTGQPKVMNQTVMDAANQMKQNITQFGGNLSLDTLDKVKQYYQSVVNEAGGYSGQPDLGLSKRIMRDATSAIADELHQADPDIAKIDAEYTVWANLRDVANSTILRKAGQGLGARDVVTALSGGGLGYLAHGIGGGTLGAAVLGSLALAMKSPAWKTVSAVTKDRLAGLLAHGDLRTAALLTTRLTTTPPANRQ